MGLWGLLEMLGSLRFFWLRSLRLVRRWLGRTWRRKGSMLSKWVHCKVYDVLVDRLGTKDTVVHVHIIKVFEDVLESILVLFQFLVNFLLLGTRFGNFLGQLVHFPAGAYRGVLDDRLKIWVIFANMFVQTTVVHKHFWATWWNALDVSSFVRCLTAVKCLEMGGDIVFSVKWTVTKGALKGCCLLVRLHTLENKANKMVMK